MTRAQLLRSPSLPTGSLSDTKLPHYTAKLSYYSCKMWSVGLPLNFLLWATHSTWEVDVELYDAIEDYAFYETHVKQNDYAIIKSVMKLNSNISVVDHFNMLIWAYGYENTR